LSTALATRGLDKSFGSLVVAKDIAFSLPQGARYALIGPNGAGKTTLINLMTGMLQPDAGEILLAGEPITALTPEKRVNRGADAVLGLEFWQQRFRNCLKRPVGTVVRRDPQAFAWLDGFVVRGLCAISDPSPDYFDFLRAQLFFAFRHLAFDNFLIEQTFFGLSRLDGWT